MTKYIFKDEPINVLDLAHNDRFLYKELIALKKEIKEVKKLYKKIDEYFGE